MRDFNATQLAIIAQNSEVAWLMTFVTTGATTYRWSLREKVYGGNTYLARIIPASFNGFQLNFGSAGVGIVAPNDFTMSAINEDGAADEVADPSDFDNALLTINLVMRGIAGTESSIAEWDFRVKLAVPDKQTIRFYITNFLAKKLKKQYPKTKYVKELEASTDLAVNDNLCVPVPFGTVYCPLRSVYVDADNMRYYVLGPNTYSYGISKVHSPIDWPYKAEWSAASYTFSTYTKALDGDNMTVLEAVIADSDEDGSADAQGLWLHGNRFLDPAVQFYRSDTRYIGGTVSGTHTGANNAATLTDSTKTWVVNNLVGFFIVNTTDGSYGIITANTSNTVTVTLAGGTENLFDNTDAYRIGGPASIIRYVLTGMGIASGNIDNSTFAEAEKTYATWGLEWQGALFAKEPNEVVIGRLLDMCFSRLLIRDALVLSPFSKASVATITSAMIISSGADSNGYRESSFKIDPIFDDSETDSGYVLFQEVDKPQDSFQRLKVAYYSGSTFDDLSGDEVFAGWVHDDQNAQRLGERIGQRRYRKKYKVSFDATAECIGIEPGDTITLSGMLYGGTVTAVVEAITIHKDCSVSIDAVIYKEALLDFLDTTPDNTTYVDNDSSMSLWQLVSTGPDGDVTSGNRQNTIYGRIRIGTGADYILLDDTDPSIKLYEGAVLRASIGDIGGASYGVAFYTPAGDASIVIDASNNVIKEMAYEIYTAGIIRTNADIAANGGWSVSPTQQIAYTSAGLKTWQVVHDGVNEGDWYCGDYDSGNAGLSYDHSAGTLNFRGDLALESIGILPPSYTMVLYLPMDEPYGDSIDASSQSYDFENGTASTVYGASGVVGRMRSFVTANASLNSVSAATANLNLYNKYVLISFWMFPVTGGAGTDYIYSRVSTAPANGITISYDMTTRLLTLYVANAASTDTTATTSTIAKDTWTHVCIAISDATTGGAFKDVAIYLNGELDKTDVLSYEIGNYASGYAYIGNLADNNAGYFYGYIDEFRIYAHATLLYTETYGKAYAQALYSNPDGSKGGRVTARSIMIGSSSSGWFTDDTGLFGESGGDAAFAFSIADGVTWDSVGTLNTGDFVVGRYLSGGAGLFWDDSADTLYINGDIELGVGDLPAFPNAQYLTFNADLTEKYGLIVHDSGQQRAVGTGVGVVWTGSGPLGGCCARFQVASTAYIDFGTNTAWDIYSSGTRNMSWSFWIYITAAPAAVQVAFGKGYGSASGWYFRVETDGKISLVVNKSGGYKVCSTTSAITYNAWNHLAFVYNYAASDAGTVDIYVNGVFDRTVSSVDTMISGSAYNLFLGKYTGATPYYFEGYLSSVKLYNRIAFTENHVRALYTMPQGARGGQLTARSVVVGTPSGSGPGTLITDTGIWAYGAAGAELFGFCTIASGTVTWNSQTLSAGEFVLGDYNGGNGLKYDASAFSIKCTGGITVTAGSVSISSTGTFACSGSSFEVTAGTATISTSQGLTISTTTGIKLSTQATLNYSGTYVYLSPASGTRLYLGASGSAWATMYLYATALSFTGTSADFACGTGALALRQTYTDITISGSLAYSFYGSYFYPIGTAGTKNLGGSSNYWANAYANMWYQHVAGSGIRHTTAFDHYDDLAIVNKYGNKEMVEPWEVLPYECTNIELLAEEEGITMAEVYDRPDLHDKIFYSPMMIGLFGLGATKQLYKRVVELEKEIVELKSKVKV